METWVFYMPLVSFSHMKLLFSVVGVFFSFFLLRVLDVLIGIYSTKFVTNSYFRFLVKEGKYIRRDDVDSASVTYCNSITPNTFLFLFLFLSCYVSGL